ncbi:hypothetical protein PGTDC60_1937 [Porphyromonas gingivalis TDC60]|uniref:restriction endonuclease subunit S n=1 Tax=Porphyromonas gingivalis TaxID=837 RepID=UPI00020F03E9|nr:restriction endonuclease subunit S [Porphyromonas gingivalis]AUR47561.1 type I restriction enzyme S subunit [Porphyromonas gingivalis]BAK26082.1 hypothetical protein PGTDC60_1937 [Porphyromonas gingivalis TDC60]
MVNSDNTILAPSPLRWCSISTEEVRNNAYRLDASAYDLEAMEALSRVYHSPYGWVYLWGENGLVEEAYYPGRYKRIYTSEDKGEPFYLPSQLEEIYPKPSKWISTKTASLLEKDRIKESNLLISRSGTIGKCAISSRNSIGKIFSDDVIRITFRGTYDLGYVYAYLNTEEGSKLLQSNNYGAVIDHIEPEHLKNLPIPNAPEEIKRSIHDAVIASYDLRDQSNDLIDEAQRLLYEALGLPEKIDLKPKYFAPQAGFRCFTMSSNELNNRFDVSYHLPEIKEILSLISKQAAEVTTLGDPRISKETILAGVFKRTYVNKESGIPFLGGRDITQLAPKVEKYLSYSVHKVRIHKELEVFENYILISDRGTIGKVQIVPKHWNGWAVSQNIIKLIPTSSSIAGYIYIYLQTSLGQALIKRETYGSVVDMIDDNNVASIPIPLLKDNSMQSRINDLVLQANELHYQAYLKEQEALQQIEKVLKR